MLEIVAEKTGYPKDMLDLDLDLEADLGVDTVKQAEMFAAVRAAYNIPRDENLKLRDFPTLAHVIQFAREADRCGRLAAWLQLPARGAGSHQLQPPQPQREQFAPRPVLPVSMPPIAFRAACRCPFCVRRSHLQANRRDAGPGQPRRDHAGQRWRGRCA